VDCGRGTQSILRARGRWLAWSSGPSTSPLDAASAGSDVVIASQPLRLLTALVSSLVVGAVTAFLIGFGLPWCIVALRYGLGPGAGDAIFIWMLIFVPLGAIVSLALVVILSIILYRKLTGDSDEHIQRVV
jgi:hypothetical protein